MSNQAFVIDKTGTRVQLCTDPRVAEIEAFLLTATSEEIAADSEKKRAAREKKEREARSSRQEKEV